jgi:hypothetical protein
VVEAFEGCSSTTTLGTNVHHWGYVDVSSKISKTNEAGALICADPVTAKTLFSYETVGVERCCGGHVGADIPVDKYDTSDSLIRLGRYDCALATECLMTGTYLESSVRVGNVVPGWWASCVIVSEASVSALLAFLGLSATQFNLATYWEPGGAHNTMSHTDDAVTLQQPSSSSYGCNAAHDCDCKYHA